MADRQVLELIFKTLKEGSGDKETAASLKGVKDSIGELSREFLGVNLASLTAAGAIAGVGKFAIDATKETMAYAESVRELSRNLGISAEEASKLLQIGDDYKISAQEMTTALQLAVKNGFVPSIDNLSKLADTYNAYTNPVERATALNEIFGRNWTVLTPILQAGGDAIRSAASEAEKMGLVLSQKDVEAARKLEVELDALDDKAKALSYTLGKIVVQGANQAADALGLLATAHWTMKDILADHEREVRKTSGSYEEYVTEMVRAKLAALGLTQEMIDNAIAAEKNMYGLEGMAERSRLATQEEWGYARAVEAGTYQTTAQQEALEQQMPALQDAADATAELAAKQAELESKMADLKGAMSAYRDGMREWAQVGQDAGSVLSDKLTPGSEAWLAAAKALDEATGSNVYNQFMYNKALEDATKAYAKTGDIDAYTAAITDAAETYKDLTPMEKLKSDAEEAYGQVEDLIAEMDAIPTEIVTYITVVRRDLSKLEETGPGTTQQVADEWKQTGLDMTVPQGYDQDNYAMNLHLKSGERVRVETPDQQNSAAPGGGSAKPNITLNVYNGFDEAAYLSYLGSI